MEAIEIYTKIMEVVKGQKFSEVSVALNFVQAKINNDHYNSAAYKRSCQEGMALSNVCGTSPLVDADTIVGETQEAA